MCISSKLLALIVSILVAGVASAATLTVLGDNHLGTINGTPGETVGYDFSFTSSGSDYAVLNFSELSFNPSFATYTDNLGINYVIVDPGQTVTQPFSLSLSSTPGDTVETGAGQFVISPSAKVGDYASGQLIVNYSLFDADPNSPIFDGTADLVNGGAQLSANIALGVVGDVPAPPVATPESATTLLVGGGLACLGLFSRLRRKQPTQP